MPPPERGSRRRRLALLLLFAVAVFLLARLMLSIARVPSEPVADERIIRVR